MSGFNANAFKPKRSSMPPDADPGLEKEPPNQEVNTHDVVRDQSRLGGVKGLTYLKQRSA